MEAKEIRVAPSLLGAIDHSPDELEKHAFS